ncbi:LPS-assembly protein LptD [Psychrobacter sp. I-STPA10]|uniref:LPS-assembly protein LptD n=1 Tax=Psychrobacter sp. I-STPA10 TaxID=2585769 RepID=UPI001E552C93|nr:LPS assembly protein LptD [Psychrobacter sp. I-STPA10]
MLYSPLYYSIRLVLIAATGLPVSLLITSQSHAQVQQNAKTSVDSDALTADQHLFNATKNVLITNDVIIDETNTLNNDTLNSIAIESNPKINSNNKLRPDIDEANLSIDSHLKQSQQDELLPEPLPAVLSADESTTNNQKQQTTDATNTDTQAVITDKTPPTNINNTALTQNLPQYLANKVTDSLETDEAARSLERLAQFYQYKPNHASESNLSQSQSPLTDTNTTTQQTKPTVATSIAPVIAPSIYYRLQQNAPARCYGTWVNPVLPSDYQRVLQQQAYLNPTDAKQSNNALPMFAQADYAYYDSLSYLELVGDVQVVQAGQFIQSDQLVINLNQGIGGAKGNILFTNAATASNASTSTTDIPNSSTSQPLAAGIGLIGVANELAYNANGQATAKEVAFASIPMQAHGYAQQLNRPNDTTIELDKVMFSTCPPNDRKWQLEAAQIDLDTSTGRGEAYDMTFRLGNVPILYLPYFNFPIDSRRASGFLLPRASIDTQSGVQVSLPYYINIAPNYDATVTTQLFSNRNPMLSGEMRYLTHNYGTGKLLASYLPHDKQYHHKDRKGLFYSHNWTSDTMPHLSANVIYNYVSDPNYLNDFDDLGLSDNTINLPRRAEANYYNDYLTGQLKIETFQSLASIDADGNRVLDKDKPYSRLPQIAVNYRLPWFENLNITGVHDSAYFKKSIDDGSENEKSGLRVYNQLSASYPLQRSWGYVTPKVSLQHLYTTYDETSRLDNNLAKDDKSQSVFVPQYSIDAGLIFYQAGSPMHWFDDSLGGYQLLSPRLKYIYAPYRDQNDVPNFNTRIASLNYSQLFADSWFLGHDRLPDYNAVTPGINYRYIDAMGVTRFDASIGKQFYLQNGRVTLSKNDAIFTNANSGIVWNSSAQPYQNLWLDFDGALKSDNSLNFVTTQLRYQPTANSLFNVGFIKRLGDNNTRQQPLSAFTASTIFPIKNNWRVLAQGQYDNHNNKMIDALVGIDYQDCCYGFAIYGRNYYNNLNLDSDPTRAIMAEFRINGFGSSSSDSRLTRLLSEKISGFEPVDAYWKQ